jgi:hypothetical protein
MKPLGRRGPRARDASGFGTKLVAARLTPAETERFEAAAKILGLEVAGDVVRAVIDDFYFRNVTQRKPRKRKVPRDDLPAAPPPQLELALPGRARRDRV